MGENELIYSISSPKTSLLPSVHLLLIVCSVHSLQAAPPSIFAWTHPRAGVSWHQRIVSACTEKFVVCEMKRKKVDRIFKLPFHLNQKSIYLLNHAMLSAGLSLHWSLWEHLQES